MMDKEKIGLIFLLLGLMIALILYGGANGI